jgi:predicted dehydrogenase
VAVASGQPAEPDFRFGLKIMETIDAVALSAAERRWVRTDEV